MRYRAFISYKHARSSAFAERLELALKAYARPLWQPPPPIFRDEKYLRPGLDLPKMIRDALDASEFLIYLASPDAAASPWVVDELVHWCSIEERRKKLIVVLTEGTIALEPVTKAIDWKRTDAIPAALRTVLTSVPYYLDCTLVGVPERQTLLDPDFKKVVNAIAAAFRDIDPLEMTGKEIVQHRKNIRTRNLLVGSAVVALILAAGGAGVALRQAEEARAQGRVSRAAQLASEAEAAAAAGLPQRALLLAVAAAEVTRAAGEEITPQVEQTLRNLLADIGGYGLSGHTGAVEQVSFFGGDTLLSIGADGQAILWHLDGQGGATRKTELISGKGRILAVHRRKQQNDLRIVTSSGHVVTRALEGTHRVISAYELPDFPSGEPCVVKVRTSEVVHVSSDGWLRTWDLVVDRPVPPRARPVAPDGGGGCSASADGAWLYIEPNEAPPVVLAFGAANGPVAVSLDPTGGDTIRAAFDPASRQLVETLTGGRVRIWRLEAERAKVRLAHAFRAEGNGNAVSWSRSSHVVALGGESGTIELWRVDADVPARIAMVSVPFEFHEPVEGRLAFERNDTLLIASDGLRAAAAIRLSPDGVPAGMQVLYNHPAVDDVMGDRATPYAVHPTEPVLVAAGNDPTASVWSIGEAGFRARTKPLRGHDGDILDLDFSDDGKWLATGGRDRVIRLWPVDPPQWTAAPAAVTFEPGDKLLNDGAINPGGGVQVARFLGSDDWFDAYDDQSRIRLGKVTGKARLQYLLLPSADGRIEGVSAREAELIGLRSGVPAVHRRFLVDLHRRDALSLPADDIPYDVDDDGHAVAAGSEAGIRLWDVRRPGSRFVVYGGVDGAVTHVRVSVAAGFLAAVVGAERLAVWRLGVPAAPLFIRDLSRLRAGSSPIGNPGDPDKDEHPEPPSIHFLSNGQWLYLSELHDAYLVRNRPDGVVWRLSSKAHERRPLSDCCVMQLFEAEFDFWMVSADSNDPTRLEPGLATRGVTAYDYNPVQRRLAIGFIDGRVQLLQLDKGGSVTSTHNVTTHDYLIRALALSNDGTTVAAGSTAGITLTRLGDDLSVRRHIRLRGHRGDVSLLRFSPSDRWLLSGGQDNTLRVHPAAAEGLGGLACAVAGRRFSTLERTRLGPDAPQPCQGYDPKP